MHVQEIQLWNVRNLKDQRILFDSGINLLIGKNGQGKTNLLEAVYVLSLLRSFRTSRTSEMISWGSTDAQIRATVVDVAGPLTVEVLFEGTRREARLNEERVKNATLLAEKVRCICFSPQDLSLVKGGPASRREFLDKHLVDLRPSLLGALVNYHRALKHKQVLLKQPRVDLEQVRVWNGILAKEALRIDAVKQDLTEELSKRAHRLFKAFSHEGEELEVRLARSLSGELLERVILEELENHLDREISARSCLIGPHRDDLALLLNGQDSRAFASQGQSRSIVLSLKLAVLELIEERWQDSPLVLLDDVDAELDRRRGELFFEHILGQARQVFITTTDAYSGSLLSRQGCRRFSVCEGECSPLE